MVMLTLFMNDASMIYATDIFTSLSLCLYLYIRYKMLLYFYF